MNWKKIFKYISIFLAVSAIVFVFLANRDLNKIYGGLTEVVDYNQFEISRTAFAITNVNVLSPNGDTFLPNQTVRVDNGVIVSIDSVSDNQRNIKTIDGTHKYLIPGLIDSHVHLFKSPNDLLLYVANGITQIRELIGEEAHLNWRKQIQSGRMGPDMYIASRRVGSFGTIEGFFMEWSQKFKNIKNADEAKAYVQELSEKGYDAVKIYSHINKESYMAINEAAVNEGLDVIGHIPWSIDLKDIWSSHQSDIAHLEEVMNALRREFGKINGEEGAADFLRYVDKRSKEIVGELLKNDISVTTTLWLVESFVRQKLDLEHVLKNVALAYENPGISEWTTNVPVGIGWLPEVNRYKLPEGLTKEEKSSQMIFWNAYVSACQIILKNLYDGGVNLMAGTDANLPPTVPGFSLHDEMISMHEAGMSASDVLRSATAIPADWMGIQCGKIVTGYNANMVLLDQNPLDDISNTKSINTVVLHGKILDRSLLDSMLESVRNANDASRKVDISQYLE